jgi:galactokinase
MKIDSNRFEQINAVFEKRFGAQPSLWCRAPGRVDLMGGHTDYNQGYILTLPIGYDTWIAARPRTDRTVRLYSLNLDAENQFDLGHLVSDPEHRWSNYPRGVASVLRAEGLALQGFDGVIHGIVPMSSGLSSSAALECVTATVFEALGGWKLNPVTKALLCQRAENQFVGVNCGILDQYTSCAGREGCALLLDCRELSNTPVKLPQGIQVVICDTKFKRELAGSEYGQRRAQCEEGARLLGVKSLRELSLDDFNMRSEELPCEVAKRCRFIFDENDRVMKMIAALHSADYKAIHQLMADSFHGARVLYEVCVPAMESMMKAMLGAPGVIGARQAGAGFGGCMAAFVEKAQVPAFAESVKEAYHAMTHIQPEVYPVEAAAGAGLISPPMEDAPAQDPHRQ